MTGIESPPLKEECGKKEYSTGHTDLEDASSGDLVTVDNTHGDAHVLHELPPEEERRILRKVDYRLVPLLAFLYLVAYVDRSNIGNAKIAGLTEDLKMKGLMYNTAVTVFFPPYALLEIPSNIVLKILKPSIWISILLFGWGLCMTLMGLTSSYRGLLAARFFLGVCESGFFPGATYLLTLWYRRYEVQRRMAVFYVSASLSGAFSGLLAFAIEKMKGISHKDGWQWIFILEGLVPILCSFCMWFLLPNSPETAKFLTKHEKEFLINRLALETGSKVGRVTNADKIKLSHVIAAVKEWKIWCAVVMFWASTIAVYGFTATIPTIIEQLGYTNAHAQLLTIPLYTAASILTIVWAFWGDRAQKRWPFIVSGFCIAIAGFIAQLAIPKPKYPGLSYGFLFLVAMGLYCPFISIVCWIANNLAPSSKRAVGMALLISIGNLGGICGSNIYIASEEPRYPAGFGVSLTICALAICAAIILRFAYDWENKKRRRLIEEQGDELTHRYTEQEMLDLGDKNPFFVYTL